MNWEVQDWPPFDDSKVPVGTLRRYLRLFLRVILLFTCLYFLPALF